MRILLDTHAFLWWLAGSDRLSGVAHDAIADPGNDILISAASAWEIATKHRLGKLPGAEVVVLPAGDDSRVDLPSLLFHLGSKGVVNLLVEGGGSVHGAFFDRGLVDKVCAFVAPVMVGGETSLSPVEGQGVAVMDNAWRLTNTRIEQIGPDWLIIGYPQKESM